MAGQWAHFLTDLGVEHGIFCEFLNRKAYRVYNIGFFVFFVFFVECNPIRSIEHATFFFFNFFIKSVNNLFLNQLLGCRTDRGTATAQRFAGVEGQLVALGFGTRVAECIIFCLMDWR